MATGYVESSFYNETDDTYQYVKNFFKVTNKTTSGDESNTEESRYGDAAINTNNVTIENDYTNNRMQIKTVIENSSGDHTIVSTIIRCNIIKY